METEGNKEKIIKILQFHNVCYFWMKMIENRTFIHNKASGSSLRKSQEEILYVCNGFLVFFVQDLT